MCRLGRAPPAATHRHPAAAAAHENQPAAPRMPPQPPAAPESVALMPGVIVIASLVLSLLLATALVLRPGGPGTRGALRAQVTSWWYLLPPVFAAWAWQPWGVPLLVLLISALAARDLHRLAAPGQARALAAGLAMLILSQAVLMIAGPALLGGGVLLAVGAAVLLCRPAARPGHRPALLLGLFALQAAGLACLPAVASAGTTSGTAADWFLYLCVVTALSDIGQFITGTIFGRHKLASRISPGKTWQGLGGGVLLSIVVSELVGRELGLAAWPTLAALGVALSLTGVAGDLLFSAGKRMLGIKDFSHLIPGHGGILDRVDSLVLTSPALLLALHLA